MAFPVFFDTCALFGQTLCDVLLSVADRRVFVPYWSEEVLAAIERNVVLKDRADEFAIHSRIERMKSAFPHSLVDGYQHLVPAMSNHPGDRHVLAACIVSPADTLVTFNTRDFPPETVEPFNVEVVHPDTFLLDQLDLHEAETMAGIHALLGRNQRPPQDVDELVNYLERSGVPDFAAELQGRAQRIPSPD